ncbi:MAG: hypothetical protein HYZ90_01250, partial [Candidatus Omnitrophica bacterium]|nr:hypothetical protein [Candidatus Omnitrophota bacterium]
PHPGEVPVELSCGNGKNGGLRIAVGSSLRVSPSTELLQTLMGLVGSDSITVRKA